MLAAFALAGGLAGLAGLLIAPAAPIGLEDGVLLGLKGMAAALLFRLGSLPLAIAGGLAIGAVEGLDPGLAGPRRPLRRHRDPRRARGAGGAAAMTGAAHDLYLFAAVLGLLPIVGLAGMPMLAQSAFVAVGGLGALRLEQAGLPIGGAVLLATGLGAVAGALVGRAGRARRARVRRVVDLGAGVAGAAVLPHRRAHAARVRHGPDAVRRDAGADPDACT